MGQAIQDHWGEVTPGYSVGLEFELPIRNRAARSRYSQRKLQLVKIKSEVEETIQNVVAESQVSLRRVNSGIETIAAAEEAIRAARGRPGAKLPSLGIFCTGRGRFGRWPDTYDDAGPTAGFARAFDRGRADLCPSRTGTQHRRNRFAAEHGNTADAPKRHLWQIMRPRDPEPDGGTI